MPNPKKDLVGMFPTFHEAQAALIAGAPSFCRCPNHHPLPRRFIHGRCTPLWCADEGAPLNGTKASDYRAYRNEIDLLPRGLEHQAIIPAGTPEHAVFTTAQAGEAIVMMRARGIRAARLAAHPFFPEVPTPPSLEELGPDGYVKERIKQIAPLALEEKIFQMLHGPADKANEIAEELLDRQGAAPRKGDGGGSTAPAIVLVLGEGASNPYEKQVEGTRVLTLTKPVQ